jgi:hypothetical protein
MVGFYLLKAETPLVDEAGCKKLSGKTISIKIKDF